MKRVFNKISSDTSQRDTSQRDTSNIDNCSICMGNLGRTNITITKCGHTFCHTCLDHHSCIDSKCPLCRQDMETKKKIKDMLLSN